MAEAKAEIVEICKISVDFVINIKFVMIKAIK